MFDLKTWVGFHKLPKEGPDLLLDTRAINERLAKRAGNPYRWKVGSFHLPRDITGRALEISCRRAGDRFIAAMAKQGWTLKSRLQVWKQNDWAQEPMTGAFLLGMAEYRVRGVFATEPKPLRFEVPREIVKQDPDHKLSLSEAVGMRK